LLAALALAGLLWLNAAPAAATPILLDGIRDAGYGLLTTDPAGDIPPPLLISSLTDWTDLTALYVFTTTTDLYVYADLPAYARDRSSGQIGLAIDTTGDVPNSGGAADPWSNPITYAYTSTHHFTGSAPLATTHTILPDVVIRADIVSTADGGTDENNGWTELRTWTGASWAGAAVNWGGIDPDEQIGDHIAFADGHGVELHIPLADLGTALSTTLHLHFYTTQQGFFSGAYDSLPSGVPTSSPFSPTVQHNLTTVRLAAPPGPPPDPPAVSFAALDFQASEAEADTAVTVLATGLITQPLTATVRALPGTASALDFVPLTATFTLSSAVTTLPFTIALLDDEAVESPETVLLSLADPLNAVLGEPASAILTVLDDDTPGAVLLHLLLPFIQR
jgi:hypothetical protein